jgi:hypothetical protein
MPRGRKPEGEQALSNAERQARYRARHTTSPSPVAVHAALPIDAVARSDGVMPSANCWHYRPPMPIGWRLFPTACRPAPPPRRLKPLLSSTSPTWRVSNCRAATAAIDANEKRDAVSFVGKKSRAEMQRYGRDYLTGAAAS